MADDFIYIPPWVDNFTSDSQKDFKAIYGIEDSLSDAVGKYFYARNFIFNYSYGGNFGYPNKQQLVSFDDPSRSSGLEPKQRGNPIIYGPPDSDGNPTISSDDFIWISNNIDLDPSFYMSLSFVQSDNGVYKFLPLFEWWNTTRLLGVASRVNPTKFNLVDDNGNPFLFNFDNKGNPIPDSVVNILGVDIPAYINQFNTDPLMPGSLAVYVNDTADDAYYGPDDFE